MELKDVMTLIGGLALFLFGMNLMSSALEKRAGNKLKQFLSSVTSNPFKGFLLGLGVTLLVQSSSATTVMVVGFVNSGLMTLGQSISVIMGANLGASATSWLISLQSIRGTGVLQVFKPEIFVPVLALIGVFLYVFQKKARRKETGRILLGFSVLMFGMEMMSGSVAGLGEVEGFRNMLLLFKNPVLGVLIGTVFTAIIQSSGASVGVLQALTVTGSVTYATVVPVVMGQNIGTCVTAMISSVGASKNAKKAAIIHLSFNVLATLILLPLFYLLNHFLSFAFMDMAADYVGVALVHTGFKLAALVILMPCSKYLELLADKLVPEKKSVESELLDERFLNVPSVALERCRTVTVAMAELSMQSILDAFALMEHFSEKDADHIRDEENQVDMYEDKIGSYLVKLSGRSLNEADSAEATELLHVIGDFERISDHAVNIVASAEEIHDRGMEFSESAKKELRVIVSAVREILSLSLTAFRDKDLHAAVKVEPLEQVVDFLQEQLKKQHISRLRRNECTIELGFILADFLTDLERVSDHCSNIAGCILEITHDNMEIHEYLRKVKGGQMQDFNDLYDQYKEKYSLPE